MSIEFASRTEIEAARDALFKAAKSIQIWQQGDLKGSTAAADKIEETDTLLTAAGAALTAIAEATE